MTAGGARRQDAARRAVDVGERAGDEDVGNGESTDMCHSDT